MTIEDMLRERHTVRLVWVEPWPALGAGGEDRGADVELRASVHDCIGMQRVSANKRGLSGSSEKDLLLDFIAIHWAVETSS